DGGDDRVSVLDGDVVGDCCRSLTLTDRACGRCYSQRTPEACPCPPRNSAQRDSPRQHVAAHARGGCGDAGVAGVLSSAETGFGSGGFRGGEDARSTWRRAEAG